MLEPEDLIQDEIEHPEQTWQLQKSYSPSQADHQSLLRIRTRLLQRHSLQTPPTVHQEELQERQPGGRLLNEPFEQPTAGQFFPPAVARPQQKKEKPLRSWRLVALVAVVCAALLSAAVYGLRYLPVQTGHPLLPRPRVTPTALPSQTVSLIDITMTSATTGWGRAVVEQDSQLVRTIVRTIDGGKTWQTFDFHGQSVGDFGWFVLDDQTAWVLTASSLDVHSQVPVLHTTDGGRHWTTLSMPPEMANMTFLDQQHGWAWSFDPSPHPGDPSSLQGVAASQILYRTMDGGKTWDKLGVMSPQRALDDVTPGLLPLNNALSMSFLTPERGWATVHASLVPQSSQRMLLYMTEDGGKTWQLQSLPQPPGGSIPGIQTTLQGDSQSGTYLEMWGPKFVTPQHGVVSIASQVNSRSPLSIYLYETNDAGQSWSPLGPALEQRSGWQVPEVLDATHLLVVGRHTITPYTLENGHWQEQPPWQVPGMATSFPSFRDRQNGWVSTAQSSSGKTVLAVYVTKDGGLSWQEVMQAVATTPPPQQGG